MIAEEQFVRTVSQYAHSLYRLALSMLRSPADAEDAVSDAIETAWRRRPALRRQEALPAYLHRCVLHQCHRTLRRGRREAPADDLSPWLPACGEGTPVWMYLSALPEKLRLPLLLRYGENMPIEEVARILRLPRGTVSSRISRGLDSLRSAIRKENEQ